MFFKKKYQGVILIDIHDVLTNLQSFKTRQGLIYAKKHGYKLQNPNAFDTREMFDWPENMDEEFWSLNLPQLLNGMGPKELAPEALFKLKQEKYKIIILYQPQTFHLTKEMQEYHKKHLRQWLTRYHLYYDEYVVTSKDLIEVAKTYHPTLFISANPVLIEHLASAYTTILFDTAYNQELDGTNITRVRNWKELYQKIKQKDLT